MGIGSWGSWGYWQGLVLMNIIEYMWTVFEHVWTVFHWVGLREILQETPIFNCKNPWFPVDFPSNQSNEYSKPSAISWNTAWLLGIHILDDTPQDMIGQYNPQKKNHQTPLRMSEVQQDPARSATRSLGW